MNLFVSACASAISTSAGGAASVAAKDSTRGKGLAFAGFVHAHLDLVCVSTALHLFTLTVTSRTSLTGLSNFFV